MKSMVQSEQLVRKLLRYPRPIPEAGSPFVTAGAPSLAFPAYGCMYCL